MSGAPGSAFWYLGLGLLRSCSRCPGPKKKSGILGSGPKHLQFVGGSDLPALSEAKGTDDLRVMSTYKNNGPLILCDLIQFLECGVLSQIFPKPFGSFSPPSVGVILRIHG